MDTCGAGRAAGSWLWKALFLRGYAAERLRGRTKPRGKLRRSVPPNRRCVQQQCGIPYSRNPLPPSGTPQGGGNCQPRNSETMRIARYLLLSSFLVAATVPSLAVTRGHHKATTGRSSSKHAAKPKLVGQREIDDDRAAQLQAALVKAGYLTGEPSGHWDAATEAAMSRLQADNGWQTKLVPDSRAIIKLGLGPSSSSLAPAGGAGSTVSSARSSLMSVR